MLPKSYCSLFCYVLQTSDVLYCASSAGMLQLRDQTSRHGKCEDDVNRLHCRFFAGLLTNHPQDSTPCCQKASQRHRMKQASSHRSTPNSGSPYSQQWRERYHDRHRIRASSYQVDPPLREVFPCASRRPLLELC